jgi:hypothetical protein
MGGAFLKGAVVGFVCAALGGAAVALAGSGVGGVFNLGVSNSVNAKTALTGASTGAQLQVTNTTTTAGASGLSVSSASTGPAGSFANSSTGTGLNATSAGGIGVFAQSGGATTPALRARNTAGGPAATFSVNGGVTPFTVSSQTKVTNLNADLVDGFHVNQIMSGGGRIAQASKSDLATIDSPDTQATVTLVAPSDGFVLLQGTVVFWDRFSDCSPCQGALRVHDVSANVDSEVAFVQVAGSNGTAMTVPVQWVFPVTAGTHMYTLRTGIYAPTGLAAGFFNPVLTAEYIPFGYNGSSTTLAEPGANTTATPTQTKAEGVSRGNP